jgi:hypothetical protein
MTEKKQWAWHLGCNGTANGPFDSQEEAIEDARMQLGEDETKVFVGMVVHTRVQDYIPKFDYLVDSMEESIQLDQDCYCDLTLREGAEREFREVMEALVKKYVSCNRWYVGKGRFVNIWADITRTCPWCEQAAKLVEFEKQFQFSCGGCKKRGRLYPNREAACDAWDS